MIKGYIKEVGCAYPIYADPSQKLYKELGLVRNLSSGKRPNYLTEGHWKAVPKAIFMAFKIGFKSGDKTQNGGEYGLDREVLTLGFCLGRGMFVAGDTGWPKRMITRRLLT